MQMLCVGAGRSTTERIVSPGLSGGPNTLKPPGLVGTEGFSVKVLCR